MAASKHFLLVNGNTSEEITSSLAGHARKYFPSDSRLIALTPADGPKYIASRSGAVEASQAVMETIGGAVAAPAGNSISGCLIACFGEPGIDAAREAFPFPVVGLAEASIVTALQLGRRFAIVTAGRRWSGMLADFLVLNGYRSRCCGIATVSGEAMDLISDRPRALKVVRDAVDKAAAEFHADTVVLGGAALVGLAQDLQPYFEVPLVDCLAAGCSQLLAISQMAPLRTVAPN